jgi:CheY-like chemotaxis protein
VHTIADICILVADDSKEMRTLVRALLRAGGATHVVEAESGEEAFALLRRHRIDLLITDWKMAPLDGLALTHMVRRSAQSPNPFIPILMLTAFTETSRVIAARDAGVSGFIKKPISAQLLFDRVSGALTDTRLFVRCETYMGPDRRRGQSASYAGPFRRETDPAQSIDLDDLRWIA